MASKKVELNANTEDDCSVSLEVSTTISGGGTASEVEELRNVKFIVNLTPSVHSTLMGACDQMGISASGKVFDLISEWVKNPEVKEANERYINYRGGPYKPKIKKKA